MKYKMILKQSEEGNSVSVPGLPGCWSQGETDAEALANIQEAIADYTERRSSRYSVVDSDEILSFNGGMKDAMPLAIDRLDEIVAALVACVHPKRIVLFGSHARGDADPDSDVDLLVVVETDLDWVARSQQAYLAIAGIPVAVDLIVVTPKEFERLSGWKSSVVYAANREGKVLHEAA